MKKIHVALGAHAYDIEIAAGLLPQVGSKVAALLPKARKAAISAILMLHPYTQQNYRLASKRLALLCIRW